MAHEPSAKPPFPVFEHTIAASVALTFAHAAAVQASALAAGELVAGSDAKAFFLTAAWQAAAHSVPLAVAVALAARHAGRLPVPARVAACAVLVVAARIAYALWHVSLDPQSGTPFFMSGGTAPSVDVMLESAKLQLVGSAGLKWLAGAIVGVSLASSRAGQSVEGLCLSAPTAVVLLVGWFTALPELLKIKGGLVTRTPTLAVVFVVVLSIALPLVERVLMMVLERLNIRERH